MYKKQVKLQKIFCYLAIAAAAVVFIYSLGLLTDLYDALNLTMRNPNDLTQTSVQGSYIYYEMQEFNGNLLAYAIVMILLSLALFVTNTHVRRKYYIGNYIASALYSAAATGGAVWGHIELEKYKAQFKQIDFEALKAHAEIFKSLVLTEDSTFWFDIHYFVFGLLIAAAALLIYNAVWKTSLMKQETALLKG